MKRKTIVRRKPAAKRYAKAIVPRNIKPRTTFQRFNRTFRFDITNPTAANPFFPGTSTLQMQLNSLPGFTDFTNLFNYYRISFVKWQFKLDISPDAQAAASSQYPTLYLQNYFTDQINWSSLNQVEETQKKRMITLKPGRYLNHTIRPCTANLQSLYPLDASNPTGVANYSAPMWKRWLPTTQPGIDYYGTRFMLRDFPAAQTLQVIAKVYVHCKDPK